MGQFEEEGTWPFVAWVKDWFTPAKGFSSMGVPKACFEKGAATINSLVYVMALKSAAELCETGGRKDTTNEYLDRASAIIRIVNEYCFDRVTCLYIDGPNAIGQRSQHVQIFAVLADAIKGEAAKRFDAKNDPQRSRIRTCKSIVSNVILRVPGSFQSRNLRRSVGGISIHGNTC